MLLVQIQLGSLFFIIHMYKQKFNNKHSLLPFILLKLLLKKSFFELYKNFKIIDKKFNIPNLNLDLIISYYLNKMTSRSFFIFKMIFLHFYLINYLKSIPKKIFVNMVKRCFFPLKTKNTIIKLPIKNKIVLNGEIHNFYKGALTPFYIGKSSWFVCLGLKQEVN